MRRASRRQEVGSRRFYGPPQTSPQVDLKGEVDGLVLLGTPPAQPQWRYPSPVGALPDRLPMGGVAQHPAAPSPPHIPIAHSAGPPGRLKVPVGLLVARMT